jgi:hypothetical protein
MLYIGIETARRSYQNRYDIEFNYWGKNMYLISTIGLRKLE